MNSSSHPSPACVQAALAAFHRAASCIPAYRALLADNGICAEKVTSAENFKQLPVVDKANSFLRFPIEQLCVDGKLGDLASVLTSSGHSGSFAFGLTEKNAAHGAAAVIDDFLDGLFSVKSRRTLLINCLPMGVKVATEACTLAETSVRPDMAVGLVQAFGRHYEQIILVGETAFIKLLLELGEKKGIEWPSYLIHVAVGEEPLAENARKYLEGILGIETPSAREGLVFSSMGVAELGLNLFAEVPPAAPLILLRRLLHENDTVRRELLQGAECLPSLFTYDPGKIFVEFEPSGRLLITTLNLGLRLPLVRYATGDHGAILDVPETLRPAIEAAGISWDQISAVPIVMIYGRGQFVRAGNCAIYPEQIKEAIYLDPDLARQITANFRLLPDGNSARVRIQLSPGMSSSRDMERRFCEAIARYVAAPVMVSCEAYETFGSGMQLDYERKFDYLGP